MTDVEAVRLMFAQKKGRIPRKQKKALKKHLSTVDLQRHVRISGQLMAELMQDSFRALAEHLKRMSVVECKR
jgi:exopolyphosphatase/pppGpp-phosphohydrolase